MPRKHSRSSKSCKLVFVGVVNRQFSELAIELEFEVGAVQFYDPDDQPGDVISYVREGPGRLLPRFRPPDDQWLIRALEELQPDVIVPTSEFAVEAAFRTSKKLGAEYAGNEPEVVNVAADKLELFNRLSDVLPMPETSEDPSELGVETLVEKPVRGAGGLGVRKVKLDEADPRPGVIFQEFVPGRHVSVTFVSDGSDVRVLSVNDQLIDLRSEYSYKGNLVPSPYHLVPSVREEARRVCEVLVDELGLVGLNGVDAVLNKYGLHVIEVNPRPTAVTECLARVSGDNPIRLHLQAFDGSLPERWKIRGWSCKRVVYAPNTVRVPYLSWTRDRPRPGTVIPRGEPVCSVIASSSTPSGARSMAKRLERVVVNRLERVSSTPPTEGWY
ncbi:ATP-grasp domain-containing protein [Methanopyrus kandleri]|uniref:Predicted ATP-dependent carboligase related to biotin carboxylase n=2 Tax=Methanopyrus kandleri TaxID=2320 RepID=Q8TV12_METKA|nr:ATP-grasp domain-containing protein [Methanopyrus kandleri]AAM02802.1 Predicted ATP-dependent carboligase related to biotin carboxylase [Methanopyrus kandleri AV19]HII71063.1 ATP-grasp domain-containing protein [Methanopyrus kandleri]